VRLAAAILLAIGVIWAQGIASRGVKPTPRGKPSGLPWHAKFTDVAASAGLTAPTIYGEVNSVSYILETSSGGVAFLDFDNDGWIDIFLVGGTRFSSVPAEATNRLYRNKGDGTFEDVTEKAGLRRTGWGSGVAVGDFDNDGDEDLFLTYWGDNVLYRNNGDGTFTDITKDSGLLPPARKFPYWGAGAAFVDYDLDGDLDLFVSNYVDFDLARIPKPGENSFCTWKGIPVACGPRGLPTGRHWLYRNEGGGKFRDVSEEAGIAKHRGSYGMTVTAADFNDDGWPDIYVACDSTPSLLFINQKNGTFSEEGVERGVALDEDGREQAGMGLGIGDYNLDGRLDIFKTHFADDTHVLYRNDGDGLFSDVTLSSGLGVETRFVGWGAGMIDLDNDGLPDLFAVTGQVYPEADGKLAGYPYRSPRLLFRNLGGGKFEQLFDLGGPGIVATHSSRGCAFGDYDNDGDIDVVVLNRNEPPSLLRNDLSVKRNWLQVKLTGVKSNRSAIGARVTVFYGGKRQAQEVMSQASFYSANDRRLHFGLGNETTVDLEVRWPGGKTERYTKIAAGRVVKIREGKGIE
jgi:ASPIC and UnbV./FG-GAP repeat.